MAIITWSKDFSVEILEIDQQHQRLIALINDLYEAMSSGKGKDIIGGILTELVNYTRTHFAAEERRMLACKYPGFQQHKAEHDRFVLKVAEFQSQFAEGRLGLTVQVTTFLKDWLKEHILGTDKKYIPYLKP